MHGDSDAVTSCPSLNELPNISLAQPGFRCARAPAKRSSRMLSNDPILRVMPYADARYEVAAERPNEKGLDLPSPLSYERQ